MADSSQTLDMAASTWQTAFLANLLIFTVGSPILVSGLSLHGIAAAFLLGTLTWRTFGSNYFILVAAYFVIGTAATKVKMAQKESQGIAEKRKGRRGPRSVVGSSAAGILCAILRINSVGGEELGHVWELGFIASFCTKLCDTVSSEIGKAFGKTTYLITSLKKVPRGSEGGVSIEGTVAGVVSSSILACVGCLMGEISWGEGMICVVASVLANVVESIIGAAFQEKKGFLWLNNDAVNVINISLGTLFAIIIKHQVR